MKNKGKIILIVLITSALPAIATYLGSSYSIIDYFKQENYIGSAFNVDLFKNLCQLASIILSFSILLIQRLSSDIKLENSNNKINGLLELTKVVFQGAFSSAVDTNINIDIRIFVPIKKIINIKKNETLYFQIVNCEGLSTAGITNGLKFKVLPKDERQGLIGNCYNLHTTVYDDNLKQNNEQYNLTKFQLSKTRNQEFSIAHPLYNESNEIVAIITIDGTQKIDISEHESAIINNVLMFSEKLFLSVPDLFKPKRRLL